MVFALETFWPATDGWSAARIEEEIVVTPTGHEVITRFPADQLLVAGAHYVTVDSPLPTTRETVGASVRQQRPYRRQIRNHGLLASISSCLRFAAELSLALNGLAS